MSEPLSGERLKHELEAIKNYLTAAQDVVKSGHMPQLAGLETRIAALCEAVQKASPDMQMAFLSELHVLIGQLDACEKAMRESKAAKAGQS